MANKPGILRNLNIKRVALVDSGANFDKKTGDGAHIVLFKSAPDSRSVHVDAPGADDQDEPDTEYEKSNLTAAQRNNLKDSDFAAVWTDAQGKKHRKLPIHDSGHLEAARGRVNAEGETKPDIPASVLAEAKRKIEAASHKEKNVKKSMLQKFLGLLAETDVEKRKVAAAALQTELEKAEPDADDVPIHKSDDPMCKCADCMGKRTSKSVEKSAEIVAMEKRFELIEKQNADLMKANTALTTQISTEIEKRETGEITSILKSFQHVSVDLNTDVAIFHKMRKSDPAAYDRAIALLKANDAMLAKSAMFNNDLGSRAGTGEGSAWGQIEAKADAMIEKSANSNLTREQALEKVMLQNPRLVAEYRKESGQPQ